MALIETDRLTLEPWSERYRDKFAGLAADPRVMQYIGSGTVWDRPRIDEVFERQVRHWSDHGFGWRCALEKQSGEWIGFVGLNHVGAEAVEVPDDEVEIGWWLHPSVWRSGYATEGAEALRDEGFGPLKLERIIGRFQPANVASGRIMEKIGMHFERDAPGLNGVLVRIYSLRRDNWLAQQGAGSPA